MKKIPFRLQRFLIGAVLALLTTNALAAASVQIWPINPVIRSEENATGLWLENRGNKEVTLQVRTFSWEQEAGDVYSNQKNIIASPPVFTVPAGEKQLIRLTKVGSVEPGVEDAYRVIVDEVPVNNKDPDNQGTLLKFQMRYSIPLFVYGEGAQPLKEEGEDSSGFLEDGLSWRIVDNMLEISNSSNHHVRLTAASIVNGSHEVSQGNELLGYVLANSSNRWPLPDGLNNQSSLKVQVNGGDAVIINKG
ncbi:fimbrial biogenesis chaperone [Halomonas caseinilytica]|uniref:Fimbrial chaperone protein n=1 Tax=Halomonas caseinilytica TaxID=438744 RepID=A0A1M6SK58_9GAMM|nr:molecular chaperone [Halomonas caseinilytica]SHK45095.1 fimbrial chaperone protein [Halomonas caseinilytica]